MGETIKPTKLRELYHALGSLYEEEQTALAEAHAADAGLLAHRLEDSVRKLENLPAFDEPFVGSNRKPLPEGLPPSEIRTTVDFVAQIANSRQVNVVDSGLGFRYVEREVSPLRTTTSRRAARRALDLLLVSEDRLPIAAELKIRGDSPTYPALIQALMYASELVPAAQRSRLSEQFPEARFEWPEQGPFVDVYLIAFEAPPVGRYRQRSFEASRLIAQRVFEHDVFRRLIRRIAYLDASVREGSLVFREEFSFPDYSSG